MAVRQLAVNQMIHECRILEDDTTSADEYGHNNSFSSAVRATGVACRYYEDSNVENLIIYKNSCFITDCLQCFFTCSKISRLSLKT